MTEPDTQPPTVTEPAPPPAPKLTHEALLEQLVRQLGVESFNKRKAEDDRVAQEREWYKQSEAAGVRMNELITKIKALAEANAQVGQ